MNCREYRKALTSNRESDRVARDRHRAQCRRCRRFAERFEAVEAVLGRPIADPKDCLPRTGFSARVMSALPERTSPLAWASMRMLPLTAALALTLLAWCLLTTPAPSALWAQGDATDVLEWVSSDDR